MVRHHAPALWHFLIHIGGDNKGLFGTFAADQALAIAKQIELDAQNGQLEAAAAGLPALQAALAAVFRELAAAAGLPAPQFP